MKFDVIVGNPPYQDSSGNVGSGHTLWDKFVKKSFELLKDNGHLCLVHPNGWRNMEGNSKVVAALLKSKDMTYLEMHSNLDAQKVFGVSIHYDWYVLENKPTAHNTNVKFQDGTTDNIDLSKYSFIPSKMFSEVKSLLAKDNEEKCEVIYSRSAYATDGKIVSKEKDKSFKHPVVTYINAKGNLKLMYSNTTDKGQFGVPKVIFTKTNVGLDALKTYIDSKGEYGMTEYCIAIVDTPDNLVGIDKCLNSKKFKEFAKCFAFGDNNLNRRVLALFRKDFWKHFVDEKGNEI